MDKTETLSTTNAELQRRDERRRFQAARLQRAHNRLLRRHVKVSLDLANLRRLVEAQGEVHGSVGRVYAAWCQLSGIPTSEERAERRQRAESEVVVG